MALVSPDLQPTTNPSNFGSGIANPTNVYTTNAAYAIATDVSSTSTVSGFGDFTLPAGAIILGIEVVCIGHYTGSGINHSIGVRIQGTGSSTTPRKLITLNLNTDTSTTIGGPTDLWGNAWVPADFANNTFKLIWGGSSLSVTDLQIDSFTARVYYTLSAGNILLMFRP